MRKLITVTRTMIYDEDYCDENGILCEFVSDGELDIDLDISPRHCCTRFKLNTPNTGYQPLERDTITGRLIRCNRCNTEKCKHEYTHGYRTRICKLCGKDDSGRLW